MNTNLPPAAPMEAPESEFGRAEPADWPARPERPAGYWERVDRIVSAAPPLSDDQRARIRAAFLQPMTADSSASPPGRATAA